jgi:transcriptional regulator with XRE-family HTH domain
MPKRKRAKNVCADRIKLARIKMKMHQVDLAAALNVDYELDITQNGISEIERNIRYVKDFEIIALSKVLEVHPMWLLFGDEIPTEFK